MSEVLSDEDNVVLKCVEEFVADRHEDLSPSSVFGFSRGELARIKVHDNGHLVFTVEDVHIKEKEPGDTLPVWYVSATLMFQTEGEPIEGSTDIYMCYKSGDKYVIEWHAS